MAHSAKVSACLPERSGGQGQQSGRVVDWSNGQLEEAERKEQTAERRSGSQGGGVGL
jgi:hypothetical protein